MDHAQDVQFAHGDTMLAGTLRRPEGSEPHPALVMLQGSGPADRDSDGYFPPLRDHFVGSGFAVLSWDKPGIGGSTGRWTRMTIFDRAAEALTAIKWLRLQDGIDASRVGIWGHSQGGWVGPLAASQSRDLAFLIVNSGPAIGLHEQDLYGIEHTLRDDGVDDEEIARALEFMRAIHTAALRGASYDEVKQTILEEARGKPRFDYLGDFGSDEWHLEVIYAQHPYDPAPPLALITCPMLVIFGELDPLVPVQKSARVFESLGASSGHDVTVRIFPGANHRIKVGKPKDFAPGYLDTMTQWIWERIRS